MEEHVTGHNYCNYKEVKYVVDDYSCSYSIFDHILGRAFFRNCYNGGPASHVNSYPID